MKNSLRRSMFSFYAILFAVLFFQNSFGANEEIDFSNILESNYEFDSRYIPEKYSNFSKREKYAYYFVKENCGEDLLVFLKMNRSSLKEFTLGSIELDPSFIEKRIKAKGRGAHLEVLLSSYGYYQGLQDCFGEDESAKNIFTLSLIMGDVLGTASGVSIYVVVTRWLGSFIDKLAKKSASLMKLSKTTRLWIKRAFVGSIIAYIGGRVGLSLLEDMKMKMKYIENIENDRESRLVKIEELKGDIQELTNMLDSKDIKAKEREQVLDLIDAFSDRVHHVEHKILEDDEDIQLIENDILFHKLINFFPDLYKKYDE